MVKPSLMPFMTYLQGELSMTKYTLMIFSIYNKIEIVESLKPNTLIADYGGLEPKVII
tara:strand:+ start:649 stop:822 length:174 start_codon:yes stop_codon:yes gene_type:complete